MTLIGVVSRGTGCGYPTQYGVYARVGEGPLRDWLEGYLPKPAPAQTAIVGAAPAAKAKPKAKPKPKKHKRKHKKRKKRRHKRR
jgi:secreted trypsin-like serine protease